MGFFFFINYGNIIIVDIGFGNIMMELIVIMLFVFMEEIVILVVLLIYILEFVYVFVIVF